MTKPASQLDRALAHGLTYRRLDYWTTKGHLKADSARPGTGYPRSWTRRELKVAELMVRLRSAGLRLDVAARVARSTVEQGRAAAICRLGPGVSVVVWMDPDRPAVAS